ncbi:PP2C family serine/threonine-protein phosphatase [Paenibacillaceae sp. P-4]|uniref:PP2C family protein-serine/threonine phosphatase n=1 Tax=Paenibacillaceae bacterium P-4 TaxID=3160969 RepID=UPI0032E80587
MIRHDWAYGLSTDEGPNKRVNEDRCFLRIERNQEGDQDVLAVIADGMGGYGAGDYASQFAIEQVRLWWDLRYAALIQAPNPRSAFDEEIAVLFAQINASLCRVRTTQGKLPGTTLSVLIVHRSRFYVYHTGDSRIYQLSSQGMLSKHQHLFHLQQLTKDHSWVGQEVAAGRLARTEMNGHPMRHVLTHCLGINQELEIYRDCGDIRHDDMFLLCTDGFYSIFRDDELVELIQCHQSQYDSLQDISDQLVASACKRDAMDNVSVVIMQAREQVVGRSRRSFWRNLIKNQR